MASLAPEKENIWLDAELTAVLDITAFRARLRNGHMIVAYLPKTERLKAEGFAIGDRVKVCMSPFDMSRGRIVLQNGRYIHESS